MRLHKTQKNMCITEPLFYVEAYHVLNINVLTPIWTSQSVFFMNKLLKDSKYLICSENIIRIDDRIV